MPPPKDCKIEMIYRQNPGLADPPSLVENSTIVVKLHSNLQNLLNFSWFEKKLTLFSTEEEEEEGRKEGTTHT